MTAEDVITAYEAAERLDGERRAAALDRDLNFARIAAALERIADSLGPLALLAGHLSVAGGARDALTRIADAFEAALMPEPPPDEREQDPGPDDAPSSPEDAAAWQPVKGGRAVWAAGSELCEVVVDRIYHSEGVDVFVVVDEDGFEYRTTLSSLRPVEALS